MHQIYSLLWQADVWIFSDPSRSRLLYQLIYASQLHYKSLSPSQKEQVDRIILWGVNKAVKFTLGDVLGEVAHQVVAAGLGEKAAELAQAAVVRGTEVGYDRAMEEVRGQ